MGKRKEEPEKENSERWLLTYSDMITLLMALFIVLYSMSNVDQAKYEQLSEGLQQAFEGGDFGIFEKKSGGGGIYEGVQKPAVPANKKSGGVTDSKKLDHIKSLIQGNNIEATESADGLTITMYDSLYFTPGNSQLSDEGYNALRSFVPALLEMSNKIRVSGYTDSLPVPQGSSYSSNWELSAARALSVMNALLDFGVPENKLSISAFGDTQPLRGNDTPEGRAYNNRVEIMLVYDKAL
jgi:chemotaxis protein MotB